MEHAWCRDPSRDERVRAAEDGRTGPLPTLGECIEQAKQAAMAAGVKEAFIQSDTGWVPLTREHLRRLEQMIPKSVSASSPVDQENKGDGMRTERVTLEVTHDDNDGHIQFRNWDQMLFGEQNGVRFPGESVRVVEEELSDAWAQRLARLTVERDAAIRERDEMRKSWLRSEESGTRLLAECNAALDAADGLRKRVAELEAASGGNHSPDAGKMVEQEPVACKNCEGAETVWCEHSQQHIGCYCARDTVREDEGQSRVIEVWHESSDPAQAHRARAARLLAEREAAQARAAELEAASGGGEGEPVAWGVRMKSGTFKGFLFPSREQANKCAELISDEVVAFFEEPPQPRGWLTGEERDLIAGITDDDAYTKDAQNIAKGLLARSSPPEVVLPMDEIVWNEEGRRVRRLNPIKVREALTSQGILFKEAT